ncbi:hypothetical protein [Cylindrospermopsis raciborskii]
MQHKFNRDGGSSVIRKYAFISQQLYFLASRDLPELQAQFEK